MFEVNGIHTVIAESYSRIFRQNMFNCGMLAIELPREDLDRLFAMGKGKDVAINVDLQNSRLTAQVDGAEETFVFDVSEFDKALVEAGGWVEFADQRY